MRVRKAFHKIGYNRWEELDDDSKGPWKAYASTVLAARACGLADGAFGRCSTPSHPGRDKASHAGGWVSPSVHAPSRTSIDRSTLNFAGDRSHEQLREGETGLPLG